MYEFLLQIILIAGLGAMVYILARALPRVPEVDGAPSAPLPARLERWVKKLPLAEIDAAILSFLEKVLRKVRVVIMKIENAVNSGISRLRKGNGSAASAETRDDLFDKK